MSPSEAWILLGAVAVASSWHPFRADTRSAASSAGLRLAAAFVFLIALFYIPELFDHGIRAGQDTSTCPSLINSHSHAWWASVVILGLVWWSVVGVMKATGLSLRRREKHAVAALAATCLAVGLAVVAVFSLGLSNICP